MRPRGNVKGIWDVRIGKRKEGKGKEKEKQVEKHNAEIVTSRAERQTDRNER